MSIRSISLSLVALVAVVTVAYFAVFAPSTDPTVAPPPADVERADTQDGSGTRPLAVVPARTAEATSPAPAAGRPAEPAATSPDSPHADGEMERHGARRPSGSEAMARRPTSNRMPVASWQRAPAIEVVQEILRETGLRMEASAEARKILDRARVTLHLENKRASRVLELVLLPHSLGFTVHDDHVAIYVEDE